VNYVSANCVIEEIDGGTVRAVQGAEGCWSNLDLIPQQIEERYRGRRCGNPSRMIAQHRCGRADLEGPAHTLMLKSAGDLSKSHCDDEEQQKTPHDATMS
jgi:hypothetical protein